MQPLASGVVRSQTGCVRTLRAGDALLDRARRLLQASIVTMSGFVVFAGLTTQVRAVRSQSPWQDDPYDGVVSLTMFCVPVVLGLVVLRLLLCRGDEPVPVNRVRGVLRAAAFGLVLMLGTVAVDVLAWVLRARHGDWGAATGPMTLAAALASLLSGALLVGILRLLAALPSSPRDDWSLDLVPLGDLLARRWRLRRAAALARWLDRSVVGGRYGVRRHPVAWSLGAAEFGAAVLVAGLMVGEGTPWWLIGPLGALVCGSGFVVVVAAANHVLRLAEVEPGRPDLRAVGLGAALGLDVAFTLRDQLGPVLGPVLGLGASISDLGRVYALMLVGAVIGALVTLLTRRTRPGQATRSERFERPIQ